MSHLDAPAAKKPPLIHYLACVYYAKFVGSCLLILLVYMGARLLNLFDVLSAFGFMALMLICLLLFVFATFGLAAGIRSFYHEKGVPKKLWLYVFLHFSVLLLTVGIFMTAVYVIFSGY